MQITPIAAEKLKGIITKPDMPENLKLRVVFEGYN